MSRQDKLLKELSASIENFDDWIIEAPYDLLSVLRDALDYIEDNPIMR